MKSKLKRALALMLAMITVGVTLLGNVSVDRLKKVCPHIC